MFKSAAPPNPLEPAIVKATNSELTAENWEFILDVCDKVNDDPEDGARNAVKAVMTRLEMQNANVQIYSLTLVLSLAQNCGSKMQRELATKSFTGQLLKMAKNRHVHQTVKSKIVELMETLSKEFKYDPSLRVMEDAFNTLKKDNPSLHAPEKPQKKQLTEADREREEEELQMVLALSLSEAQSYGQAAPKPIEKDSPPASHGSQFQPPYEQQQQQQQKQPESQKPKPKPKTAAAVTRVRALYDLNSTEEGELSFRKGDVIHVIESVYKDWWRGTLRGQIGIFPLNYVTPLQDPTPEELAREAQDELNVFAQSRNIEKLLAILSSAEGQDGLRIAENEQLQNLYHSTLAVRPKLVKLIDRYSQKKDDLIQLNDKFINARRIYDNLMENSLAQYRVDSSSSSHSRIPMPSQPPYPVDEPQAPNYAQPQQYQPQQPQFQAPQPQQQQPNYPPSQPQQAQQYQAAPQQQQQQPQQQQQQQQQPLAQQGYQYNQPIAQQHSGGSVPGYGYPPQQQQQQQPQTTGTPQTQSAQVQQVHSPPVQSQSPVHTYPSQPAAVPTSPPSAPAAPASTGSNNPYLPQNAQLYNQQSQRQSYNPYAYQDSNNALPEGEYAAPKRHDSYLHDQQQPSAPPAPSSAPPAPPGVQY